MTAASPYKDFINRLMLLIGKHPQLITTTLSNIFTMRLIGNKTHGDLAEIAIAEFVNQYMYDFNAEHVGKDRFRAKSQEEDILVTNEMSQIAIPISLKAYGNGPLQISTDKERRMYPLLEKHGGRIGAGKTAKIMRHEAFSHVGRMNVLSLIYDETNKRCNIMVFDFSRAVDSVKHAEKENPGKQRKHPAYKFYDENDDYIFEVRYGGAAANALQRGLWTNTKNASAFFDSVTNGWVDYSHNPALVNLFSHALVAGERGHKRALAEIRKDIARLKKGG